MTREFEEKIFNAIVSDDLKSFAALMTEAQCGAYRFGRFPTLSLMYLYNSRKIISAYEEDFLAINSYEKLSEPPAAATRFAERAGKCLRLYSDDEIVTPLEMLLILDDSRRLKKVYPSVALSEAAKGRMKSIYSIKYSLELEFEGRDIVMDRRPMTRKEKRKLFTVLICCILAVAIVVAVPVTTVSLLPKRVEGAVTKLSQIDFGSRKTYTLQEDIILPDGYTAEKWNCSISGNGKKMIMTGGASFGELGGELSDMTIVTNGNPIFKVCQPESSITDVTVEVTAAGEIRESGGFVTLTNYGKIERVKVNVSGSMSAVSGASDGAEEIVFGGIAMVNSYTVYSSSEITYGSIKDCRVNFSDFNMKGELAANAAFGGVVGVNGGAVENCVVTGKITADTFDLAGVCYLNAHELTGNVNEANLIQSAENGDWTPIVGGIVIENASKVENCRNVGNISVTGVDSAICGGIAARSYGSINYCLSGGEIFAEAKEVYVGGIFGRSEVVFENIYVYFGATDHCLFEGKIEVNPGEGTSCVGGIGGFVQTGVSHRSDGNGGLEDVYWCGGVTDSIFLGTCDGNFEYYGNIVGVCGAAIYEANSYMSDGIEHLVFDGNYYSENDLPPIGATVEGEAGKEDYKTVPGKGALSAPADSIKSEALYADIMSKFTE